MTEEKESPEFRKKADGLLKKTFDGLTYEKRLYLSTMIGNLIRGVRYNLAMPDIPRNRANSESLLKVYEMICSELGIEPDNPPAIVFIPLDYQPIDPKEFRIYTRMYKGEICDEHGFVDERPLKNTKRYRMMNFEETLTTRRVFENWLSKYGKGKKDD